jgi:hypothetical protein
VDYQLVFTSRLTLVRQRNSANRHIKRLMPPGALFWNFADNVYAGFKHQKNFAVARAEWRK